MLFIHSRGGLQGNLQGVLDPLERIEDCRRGKVPHTDSIRGAPRRVPLSVIEKIVCDYRRMCFPEGRDRVQHRFLRIGMRCITTHSYKENLFGFAVLDLYRTPTRKPEGVVLEVDLDSESKTPRDGHGRLSWVHPTWGIGGHTKDHLDERNTLVPACHMP